MRFLKSYKFVVINCVIKVTIFTTFRQVFSHFIVKYFTKLNNTIVNLLRILPPLETVQFFHGHHHWSHYLFQLRSFRPGRIWDTHISSNLYLLQFLAQLHSASGGTGSIHKFARRQITIRLNLGMSTAFRSELLMLLRHKISRRV